MVRSRFWAALLVGAVLVGLAGCAVDDTTTQVRKVLATDSRPQDALPDFIQDPSVVPGSSRLVGVHDAVSYYVTEYIDPESGSPGICLVLTAGEYSTAGCGSDTHATRMSVAGSATGSARIVATDDPIPDGWTKLGGFLIVNSELKTL